MKKKKGLFAGLTLACAVGALVWYWYANGEATQRATVQSRDQEITKPIPTALVGEPNYQKLRNFPGIVKSRNQVDLAFSIGGMLVLLNGQEGSLVKKGEIIAKLDDRDARNSLEAAKANFNKVQADFSRAQALFEKDLVAQSKLDDAKASLEVADSQLKIQEKALEDTVIMAPYDGVVANRYVENFAHVQAQQAIIALTDTSDLEIAMQVPEGFMAKGGIENFSNIKARFDISGERWFDASVKEFNAQSNSVTRTYEVILKVRPPADLAILPGMTATVQFALAEKANNDPAAKPAIAFIPAESVLAGSDGKTYVWQIPDQPGAPKKVEVELGVFHENGIEVLVGIKPGSRVATAGIHSLHEEMRVRPMLEGREGLDG